MGVETVQQTEAAAVMPTAVSGATNAFTASSAATAWRREIAMETGDQWAEGATDQDKVMLQRDRSLLTKQHPGGARPDHLI